jgi:copper(I)-binding protein
MTKYPTFQFHLALMVASMFMLTQSVAAHSYRIGDLEIVHPAIMVPQANSNCTCAHVTIINDLHRHEWCLFLSNIHTGLEADMGMYPASLLFRHAGTIEVEFMVDAPNH